jgi:hypothetical protein
MSPPIVPPGPHTPLGPHAPKPVSTQDQQGFAQVYDLALARAKRSEAAGTPAEPVIPVSVLEEMEAASRMFHALHAQGHELRFEQEPDARVRAELRTVDGDVVRPVSLSEAIDVLGGGPDFAA